MTMFDWMKLNPSQRRRPTMLFLGLLAMAIQCFIVQTHIHNPALENAAYQSDSSTPHDKYPPSEDPANCPLCQEIVHFGHIVLPVPAVLSLPVFIAAIAVVAASRLLRAAVISHPWQSRAPPPF